ncbi:hypothetical protein GFK91_28865 (plasmid) [Roseibium aggregatum]|uniref:hypothetical protein n=1 Tax=Roseibium aggregatum TaxID=187304 RepID=UPI001E31397B|nr:hypothetical protein [Roseibium aggregatum]UES59790.1 hypothetical protein GFK91_28865 [Roseibium aggregatum]
MTDRQGIPKVGDIWEYPYLWAWQADHGETEGRKSRPCALTLVNRKQDNLTEVILVPITTKEPVAGSHFVEVPQIEKRRAGLDERLGLWVICDEFNSDMPEHSYYFEPGGRIGAFSIKFTKQVQAELVRAIKARKSVRIFRR